MLADAILVNLPDVTTAGGIISAVVLALKLIALADASLRPRTAYIAADKLTKPGWLLILITFGIVEFGIAYNRVQGLHAAAREGARIASVGATSTEITDRVREAQSLFNSADVDVTVTPAGGTTPCADAGIGNSVTVLATVSPNAAYAIDIPLLGSYSMTYSSSAEFRCERTGS